MTSSSLKLYQMNILILKLCNKFLWRHLWELNFCLFHAVFKRWFIFSRQFLRALHYQAKIIFKAPNDSFSIRNFERSPIRNFKITLIPKVII